MAFRARLRRAETGKGMTSRQERRRTPRVAEQVPLAITDAQTVMEAETKNLSASGVYCALERFIAPMTKLQLEF